MYHSAPNSYGMLAFRSGCKIVLEPRFDPEDMLQLIARHGVTHMHMVPTMFVRLLRLPDQVKRRNDLSSLRFVVHGRGAMPAAGQARIIDWWGPVVHDIRLDRNRSSGVALGRRSARQARHRWPRNRGRHHKIFRPDGSLCDVDQPGQIFMRQVATPDFDYHGKAEARAEAGRDGLVSVGDVGYLDADGYLFLRDRKRDMVISGGVNIYPAEIENALIGMDGVRDCAVFGVPDDEFGERLFAYIERDANAVLSAAAVQDFLRTRTRQSSRCRRISSSSTHCRAKPVASIQAQTAGSSRRWSCARLAVNNNRRLPLACPFMMLWTAPPPAHECHGCGRC